MKKNLGVADRLIRVIIAAIIFYLNYNGTLTGTLGIVLMVFASIFVLTSFLSFCPIYYALKLSTRPKEEK
ncbi:MAG: DUF2892 domain-containing protein [Bacteroidia bacterium]